MNTQTDQLKLTLRALDPLDLPAVLLFIKFLNWKAGRRALSPFEILAGGFLYYRFRLAKFFLTNLTKIQTL